MSTASLREDFIDVFSALFPRAEWPAPKLERVLDSILFRKLEAGATILREGQACASAPFVMRGSIRVFKTAESGREITLYRIEKGQSCILGSSCGSGIAAFPAAVVAETATSAAFIPSATIRSLLAEGPAFRDFVLAQFSRRMAEVIELVEEVAFRRVDERLGCWLSEASAASPDGRIAATHQAIADHLGTSREVVSRILKDWEQRGLLSISRGAILLKEGFEKLPM
jgi:CRP/FNR family transcriptional regulator